MTRTRGGDRPTVLPLAIILLHLQRKEASSFQTARKVRAPKPSGQWRFLIAKRAIPAPPHDFTLPLWRIPPSCGIILLFDQTKIPLAGTPPILN